MLTGLTSQGLQHICRQPAFTVIFIPVINFKSCFWTVEGSLVLGTLVTTDLAVKGEII